MRHTLKLGIFAAAVVIAAPFTAAFTPGAGTSAADGIQTGGGTFLPFVQRLRRCDYSKTKYTSPSGTALVTGELRSNGNTVSADVQMAMAIPHTQYAVRLIQVPRPSSEPCTGSDPGVAAGVLHTDGVGAAALTLEDTIEPDATGAWVIVTRPAQFSQIPAEFYSTDLVVNI